MIKRVIIKDGKKYIVNCASWNDDVGPGAPPGTLWEQSITDGNWYNINVSGSGMNAVIYITTSSWQSPGQDYGYQLVQATNGEVYQVYLSGSGTNATLQVAQTPWPIQSDYKPYLYLLSVTDGNYYDVYLFAETTSSVGYTADTSLIKADTTLVRADNGGTSVTSGSIYLAINSTPFV